MFEVKRQWDVRGVGGVVTFAVAVVGASAALPGAGAGGA
jgi:hypothetical protein